jgi:lipopolysaccharide biosynthesis protein
MRIAVCVHLYHFDMWDDIKNYLNNLKYPFNLYVNIPINEKDGLPSDFDWEEYYGIYQDLKKGIKCDKKVVEQHYVKYGVKENRFYKKIHLEIREKIEKFHNNSKVFYTKNVGMDIGGFLQTYKHIDHNIELILKIHTKKCLGSFENKSFDVERYGLERAEEYGKKWFIGLMDGVLKNEDKIDKILQEFRDNKKCGMIGYQKYQNYKKNSNHIQKLFELFSFKVNLLESSFIGGTIFWVRKSAIDKYLTSENIDETLNLLLPGYSHEPSYAHAMERMFAYFIYDQNQEVIVID